MAKKSCCTSFWSSWGNRCNCIIHSAISITWCQCQHYMHHMSKSHVAPHLDYLNQTNVIMPFRSHNADASASGITWPKSDVKSHFENLDLLSRMVPLMILSVSSDTDNSINCITWPKCYVAHIFKHLDLMNAVVVLTIELASHDAKASANSVKWLKKLISYLILIILT